MPPVIETALIRLLDGHTIGSAFESFNQQYAVRSLLFSDKLHSLFQSNIARDNWNGAELDRLKIAMVDARNYIVLGDPAVRLPIDSGPEVDTHPTIEQVPHRASRQKPSPTEQAAAPQPSFAANGVNGATGQPLQPQLTLEQIVTLAGKGTIRAA